MARSFAAGTDNLTASPLASQTSWFAGGWFNFSAFTDLARLFHTDPTGTGLRSALRLSGTGGALQAQTDCATLDADSVTTTTITTGKWWFIAACIDTSLVLHIYIGDLATACTEASYLTSVTGIGAITSWNQIHFGNNHGGATGMTATLARPFVGSNANNLCTVDFARAVQLGLYSVLYNDMIGFWDLMNADPARNPCLGAGAGELTRTGVTYADEPPVPFKLAA